MYAPEDLIPLTEVPNLPLLKVLQPCEITVWRWYCQGLKGSCGNRIFLKAIKIGSRPCTTEAWLQEFFEAMAAPTAIATTRTPASADQKKQARIAKARQQIQAAGKPASAGGRAKLFA